MNLRKRLAPLFLILSLSAVLPLVHAGCVTLDDNGVAVTTGSLGLKSSGSSSMINWLRARALNERNQGFSDAFADAAIAKLAKDLIRAIYNIELARIAHVHEANPVQAYSELKRAQKYIEGDSGSAVRQAAYEILLKFVSNYTSEQINCSKIANADFMRLKRVLYSQLKLTGETG